ncbi:NmrA family transcriptional regulator [Streptomyces sp. B6B3]|uniref:NmrA family transcriptional regulator n=1 Tax=Streptomyces sp. B6B3 TaxID=3153570 RepID=UPI00325E050E
MTTNAAHGITSTHTTDSPTADTHLVLGGTGKTGRRVAERLAARGASVRIGSRSGTPRFDWTDQRTWEPVLREVTAAYVAYAPDISAPDAAEHIGALGELAAAHDVRLVLLSGRGMASARPAERALRESGAAWTILRCDWFAQNFSEEFLRDLVLAGEIALPTGEVPTPFVDADDIAEVATTVLLDPGHAGAVHELTGPRSLTVREATAEIAAATGRELRYLPVSADEFVAGMVGAGVPAELAGMVAAIFTETFDGRNTEPTDDVRRLLGREARDFADYARSTAPTGVWRG